MMECVGIVLWVNIPLASDTMWAQGTSPHGRAAAGLGSGSCSSPPHSMEVLLHFQQAVSASPAELPSRQGSALSQNPPEVMKRVNSNMAEGQCRIPGLFLAVTQVAYVMAWCDIFVMPSER